MRTYKLFDEASMKAFEPEAKVGLLATINPDGLPHLTLITAMQAKTPGQVIWGQFTEGLSKANVRRNPKTAFLILTMDRKLWRGKAVWTHAKKEGEDYIMFNSKPMFRYNAYLGIHTVHYMDLVETYGKEGLPLGGIILASLFTKLTKSSASRNKDGRILKPWAEGLFNRIDALKFITFIGTDGFPVIIPLLQCQAADSTRLAFAPFTYRDEIDRIPDGAQVAVLGLTVQMEDCLIRGVYRKSDMMMPLRCIDIEWVYNPMPPKQGQIYPELKLSPIENF